MKAILAILLAAATAMPAAADWRAAPSTIPGEEPRAADHTPIPGRPRTYPPDEARQEVQPGAADTRGDTTQRLRAIQGRLEAIEQRTRPQPAQGDVWQRANLQPAAWRDVYDAATRIRAGSSMGSGAVFHVDQSSVWVITNAHVVGSAASVEVEFFKRGYKSIPIAGRVTYRNIQRPVDVAIVAVPRQSLGGHVPVPLPFGPDLQVGEELISVGCPLGDWPALWNGRVYEVSNGYTRFLPGSHSLGSGRDQMQGRSGSVICNAEGTHIAGLIAWHDGRYGVAQPVSLLMQYTTSPVVSADTASDGEDGSAAGASRSAGQYPTQRPRTYGDDTGQCPPWGCPRQPPPQQPPAPQQPYGGGGQQNPWPNLPPESGPPAPAPQAPSGPQIDATQLADITARLESLERDRAEFAAEWTQFRAAYQQIKTDLPELKQWVKTQNNQQLQEAVTYAERLVKASEHKIEDLQAEVEQAKGLKGWARGELDQVRDEVRGYLKDLATTQNAVELLKQYRDHRQDHTPAESIKLVLMESLGALREDLRGYAASKVTDAKEEAKSTVIESAGSLAIKFLPWPIATALTAASAAWACVRRRREERAAKPE